MNENEVQLTDEEVDALFEADVETSYQSINAVVDELADSDMYPLAVVEALRKHADEIWDMFWDTEDEEDPKDAQEGTLEPLGNDSGTSGGSERFKSPESVSGDDS